MLYSIYIRELTFAFFQSNYLVTEATGWRFEDIENEAPFTFPNFPKDHTEFRNNFDSDVPFHDFYEFMAVDAIFRSLRELSTDSLHGKVEFLRDKSKSENRIPVELVFSDYVFWARKTYWEPSEAILISLGLRPVDSLQQFYNDLDDRSLRACGLLRAYRDRLKLLYAAKKSGLSVVRVFGTKGGLD